MIRAVLFDFGGVLSPGGGQGSIRRLLANTMGIDETAVRAMDQPHKQLMTGKIDTQTFLKELSSRHPGSADPATMDITKHGEAMPRSPEVYALVSALRQNGIATGVLSNLYGFGGEALKKVGAFDGFDPVLLSYEAGLMKPDPAFYKLALTQFGLPAAEVLYIDDRPEMLVPAQRLGMHALLATASEQIVADTKAILLQENALRLQ